MVVQEASINNIMGGLEGAEGVKLHTHRRKLKQRFDIIKKLGQGTYGKVQLGVNKETGQEVAIKTIKKCKIETEADLTRIRREIQIMSSLRHPFIIHIYEVFENKDKIVLVMEYAAGGELYDFLSQKKVLEEKEARRIFRQIAMAVYYCHKHQICHRDLKLENILLDEEGNAKIADFGLSNVFDASRLLSTFCGSPLYASPEIVKGIPYYGPEVDCWSMGVLLYTLVYGAMPFDGSNFKRLVRQISQGEYYEPKTPSNASGLIRSLLTVDGAERLDIVGVCSHAWLNSDETSCVKKALELSAEKPVRLDLLLSLAPQPPTVVADDRPSVVKSHSLGSVPPAGIQPFHKRQPSEDKKKSKKKIREGSLGREEKKKQEEAEMSQVLEAVKKVNENLEKEAVVDEAMEPLLADMGLPEPAPQAEPPTPVAPEAPAELPEAQQAEAPPDSPEGKTKEPVRRRSRVFDAIEAINRQTPEKPVSPGKKVIIPQKVDQRMEGVSSGPATAPVASGENNIDFKLASTVNLDQLIRNEITKDEPADHDRIKKDHAVKVISHAISESTMIGGDKKASTLPRRKLSLGKPTSAPARMVEPAMVANTKMSQVVYPTPAPRPSLGKQDSGPREHIIPITLEERDSSPPPSQSSEKPPLAKQASLASSKASTSSLGRQDSDSWSSTSGEPIRKSPREVIIPIAVEGGGFITPSQQALSRLTKAESEEDGGVRSGFGLHSTRRKQLLDTADSVSSDEEDDNFEILTAESLFSTLLSRVRSLTQRLNDDTRPSFPSRLLSHHQSIFDSPGSSRSTITSSRRSEDLDATPWRRQSSLSSATLPRARVTVHVPLVEKD